MHETAHMRTISCIRSYEYYIMSLILVCKQRKVNSFFILHLLNGICITVKEAKCQVVHFVSVCLRYAICYLCYTEYNTIVLLPSHRKLNLLPISYSFIFKLFTKYQIINCVSVLKNFIMYFTCDDTESQTPNLNFNAFTLVVFTIQVVFCMTHTYPRPHSENILTQLNWYMLQALLPKQRKKKMHTGLCYATSFLAKSL